MVETAVETFSERYNAILTAYGMNPSVLAELTGETVAKFYKYRDGVKPRHELLLKILNALPDLSEEYLFKGEGPVRLDKRRTEPVKIVEPQSQEELEELIRTKLENEFLRKQVAQLQADLKESRSEARELNRTIQEFVKSFPTASSQFTALPASESHYPRIVVQGFRQLGASSILSKLGLVQDENGDWYYSGERK